MLLTTIRYQQTSQSRIAGLDLLIRRISDGPVAEYQALLKRSGVGGIGGHFDYPMYSEHVHGLVARALYQLGADTSTDVYGKGAVFNLRLRTGISRIGVAIDDVLATLRVTREGSMYTARARNTGGARIQRKFPAQSADWLAISLACRALCRVMWKRDDPAALPERVVVPARGRDALGTL